MSVTHKLSPDLVRNDVLEWLSENRSLEHALFWSQLIQQLLPEERQTLAEELRRYLPQT